MRYDPASRVLSLSFTRDPREHADVMLEMGRRLTTGTDPLSVWTGFGLAIGFGAIVGIAMEIHRRFVLPLILGPAEIAPFGTVVVQILPLVVLIVALYGVLHRRATRRRLNALTSRLQRDQVVDVDIFTGGVVSSSGGFAIEIDWPAVTNILADADRIEIECESFAIYLPERAFVGRLAYNDAARQLRRLWHEAVKHEHDSRMVAAGLV